MVRFCLPVLLCTACAPVYPVDGAPSPEMVETAIETPGFVDFLTVDGDGVWVTNRGRIERWTTKGKSAEVAIPRPCGTMAAHAGKLWVANCQDGDLYRIDMQTAAIEATLDTGIANLDGETNVVAGAGSIWIPNRADGRIARVDPVGNSVQAEIEVVPGTYFLSFGFEHLWAVSNEGRLLQRIDPATNAVTGTVELGNQPGFLAAGEGAVWVQEQKDGTVARIAPDSMEVLGRTRVGETLLWGDIDTGNGSVWLRTTEDQAFVKLDAHSGEVVGRFGEPVGSGAVRFTPDGIWTSAHDVDRISRWTHAAGSSTEN